ncbi:MAG: hypothetical protein EPN25_12335 [Nitrospirae bacterium]|nr:MAG: hypothetical protein EPN25_12335 [Nitrospirota bacterium]
MRPFPAYNIQPSLLLVFLILFVTLMTGGCNSIKGLTEDQGQKVQEAYLAYFNAMIAGDIPTLKKHLSRERIKELDAPEAGQMLAMVKGLYPTRSQITAVNVTGDTATISLSGQSQMGTVSGTVNLVKEDGIWKVSKESWEMKMGMQEAPPQAPLSGPGVTTPYDYHKVVGVWKGHEAGRTGDDWEFTFGENYELSVKAPDGQGYRAAAMVDMNLGVSGNSLMVLPGGAVFDMKMLEAPSDSIGKISLGSYKIMGDTLQLCGGAPGRMKRTSDFASTGGIRCFELRRISGPPAGYQPPPQPQAQPVGQPSSGPSPFSKQDPGVTGEAVIVKDGKTETFPIRTGFFSETRMAAPTRASVQFQAVAAEHSNARRIELILDATRTGAHYVDGKLWSDNFMGRDQIAVGERTAQGYTASFRWVNDGGQMFWPKTSCIIDVTSAYTGTPSSLFAGEIQNCQVHSAGIDYTISSVKFMMRGAPAR